MKKAENWMCKDVVRGSLGSDGTRAKIFVMVSQYSARFSTSTLRASLWPSMTELNTLLLSCNLNLIKITFYLYRIKQKDTFKISRNEVPSRRINFD